MNMSNEPIRLPALAFAVGLVALVVVVALVMGVDFNTALGYVAGALALGGGTVAVAESKRARTDSPATIETRLQGLAATPLPDDERDGCGHDEV